MPNRVVESLMLLLVPVVAFGLLAWFAGRWPASRLSRRVAFGGALLAGLCSAALSPRCMCSDTASLLTGTALIGLVAGFAMFGLVFVGHRLASALRRR